MTFNVRIQFGRIIFNDLLYPILKKVPNDFLCIGFRGSFYYFFVSKFWRNLQWSNPAQIAPLALGSGSNNPRFLVYDFFHRQPAASGNDPFLFLEWPGSDFFFLLLVIYTFSNLSISLKNHKTSSLMQFYYYFKIYFYNI